MASAKANYIVWIDDSCINCDMCVPECPSEAITMGATHYEINTGVCILCRDYYAHETCIAVCPLGSVGKKPV